MKKIFVLLMFLSANLAIAMDPDCTYSKGNKSSSVDANALHDAVKMRDLEQVRYLIALRDESGNRLFDLDTFNGEGKTPLHLITGYNPSLSSAKQHYNTGEITKLLLEAGANPNIHSRYGESALFYAVKHANKEAIKHLLAAGADVINIDTKENITALQLAIYNDHDSIVEILSNSPQLGIIYYNDGLKDLKINKFKSAKKWFLLSNSVKLLDSKQLFNILNAYNSESDSVKEPFFDSDMVALFKQQAENQEDSLAQSNLGYLYLDALGVEKNINEAIRLFTLSADKGNTVGLTNLAWTYERYGMLDKAFDTYTILANQGDHNAQYMVGMMYLDGRGVTQDAQAGIRFLNLSSDQGNPNAQNSLGFYYENGWRVKQDYKEATRLYTLASQQGHQEATHSLRRLQTRDLGDKKLENVAQNPEMNSQGEEKL